jgi:hypothetical protein
LRRPAPPDRRRKLRRLRSNRNDLDVPDGWQRIAVSASL